METLGRERKNLSLKKKKPKRIRTIGNKIDIEPKYLSKYWVIKIKDGWLFEKERRRISPEIISPKEKIE